MAPMKVYGGGMLSTATQRVLAALYEKCLEFEMINVDLRAGEHKKESFLAINPFGQVPAFEHGDLKLFESRAITKYIAHECPDKGTQLILSPGKEMAILGVWIEVEGRQFDPVAWKLCFEQVYKFLYGLQADPAVVEEHEAKLCKILDVYEVRLSQFKYLAANHFTLADLHHIPTLQLLIGTPTKKLFDCRPHVCAWVNDILARPAWAKVLAMKNQ